MPTLLYGKYVRADGIAEFGEHACARGSLGVLPAKDVMPGGAGATTCPRIGIVVAQASTRLSIFPKLMYNDKNVCSE